MGVLFNDDVRGGDQHADGGQGREQGEDDKAEPVEHHGTKLPVALDDAGLLLVPDLVGDGPDLLEDEAELAVHGGGVAVPLALVVRRQAAHRPAHNIVQVLTKTF